MPTSSWWRPRPPASTDSEGRFFLLNVAPGIYTLRATYVGYRAVTIEEVRVSADPHH